MKTAYSILIADDDLGFSETIQNMISAIGYESSHASSVTDARKLSKKNKYDILISDLKMPQGGGIEIVKHFRNTSPSTEIIVITAFPEENHVKVLEELNVSSLLTKPISLQQLKFSLLGAIERREKTKQHFQFSEETEKNEGHGLVGVSDYLKELRKQIELAASGDFPVLIQGDSGTGKEIVATAIHKLSKRALMKMVVVNCAAIPPHLEESEFFGHKKGAFTGAANDKQGIISCADNTTLFLDEIGELSLEIQAKLLRVLDNGEYTPVGEVESKSADIRIISATNKNLGKMVEKGTFRKDLYYRLRGSFIQTVALTNHKEDIPFMINHFLRLKSGKVEPIPISIQAMNQLVDYDWPGNVRELKHKVNLLYTHCKGLKKIEESGVEKVLESRMNYKIEDIIQPYYEAKSELINNFEIAYFSNILIKNNGNISKSAKFAKIPRPYLQKKLKQLNIAASNYKVKKI